MERLVDLDSNGAVVQHRGDTSRPPRSWVTFLIGNPLATADAAHEAINIVVTDVSYQVQ